jgi:hypothetical protein
MSQCHDINVTISILVLRIFERQVAEIVHPHALCCRHSTPVARIVEVGNGSIILYQATDRRNVSHLCAFPTTVILASHRDI